MKNLDKYIDAHQHAYPIHARCQMLSGIYARSLYVYAMGVIDQAMQAPPRPFSSQASVRKGTERRERKATELRASATICLDDVLARKNPCVLEYLSGRLSGGEASLLNRVRKTGKLKRREAKASWNKHAACSSSALFLPCPPADLPPSIHPFTAPAGIPLTRLLSLPLPHDILRDKLGKFLARYAEVEGIYRLRGAAVTLSPFLSFSISLTFYL